MSNGMPKYLSVEERYNRDPKFKALVWMLRSAIEQAEFTPTEIREAAILAATLHERQNPRPIVFLTEHLGEFSEPTDPRGSASINQRVCPYCGTSCELNRRCPNPGCSDYEGS